MPGITLLRCCRFYTHKSTRAFVVTHMQERYLAELARFGHAKTSEQMQAMLRSLKDDVAKQAAKASRAAVRVDIHMRHGAAPCPCL
jgi:hypothetical protein